MSERPEQPGTIGHPRRAAAGVAIAVMVVATLGLAGLRAQPGLAAGVVWVSPGDSIQAGVKAAGPGGTVVIRSGVHTRQTIKPLGGQTIVGQRGAILDGRNKFGYAIIGGADRVTVRNLTVRNYNSGLYLAAIQIDGPPDRKTNSVGWRLSNLDVYGNTGHGVNMGERSFLTKSRIHHNGQLGVGGYNVDRVTIARNEIYANNQDGHDSGNHAGGIKAIGISNMRVTRNFIHDNDGVGIWCDLACNNTRISHNTVWGHVSGGGAGIQVELSKGAAIYRNTVKNCGRTQRSWLWGAGVLVDVSSNVSVRNNRITNCDAFVGIVQQDRSQDGNTRADHVTVTDNLFVTSRTNPLARIGVVQDIGDPRVFDRDFTFDRNEYTGSAGVTYVFDEQFADRGFWSAQGFDNGGARRGRVGASSGPGPIGPGDAVVPGPSRAVSARQIAAKRR